MDFFHYKDGEAYCEELAIKEIAAKVGTPAYIYSRATLRRHLKRIKDAFAAYPTLACFAVKANSNLSILRDIFDYGLGADLVSGGELARSLRAGVQPESIVFSGVGKKDEEILAGLKAGIGSFNVESSFELNNIQRIAAQYQMKAPICLRVNPNIDAKTNPKIATGLFSTKFGISEDEIWELVDRIKGMANLELVGLACHIGSQITELRPIKEAAIAMSRLANSVMAKGHPLKILNMGGGLGIRYSKEETPEVEDYAKTLIDVIKETGLKLVIEPGRLLVGNVGILVTQVIGVKKTPQKKFIIVDGAMNDILRPSLYDSYHEILAVKEYRQGEKLEQVDIVGPICETGDFFGKDRLLPLVKDGDLLYLRGCGAYGASMASNYNSRPRAPEILVDGDRLFTVKPREKLESLWIGEDVIISEEDSGE